MPSSVEGGRKAKPKVACVPCAKGKRSCSGTLPCDRCTRLNKQCSYPDEQTRRKRVRRVVQVELMPHGGFSPAFFGCPHPTAISLPRQLYPWQDIRLHAAALHSEAASAPYGGAAGEEGGSGRVGAGIHGNELSENTVSTGADKESYLKFLWDATLATQTLQSVGDSDGEDGDEHDEDGTDAAYDSGPGSAHAHFTRARVAPPGARRTYREPDELDDDDVEDGASSDLRASAGKRGRGAGAAPLPAVTAADLKKRRSADGAPGPSRMEHALTARPLREMSAIATVLDDAHPCWVAIFDTTSHYGLEKLVCNARCLELFGWSQAEINLRVGLQHVIRWIHPEDVLVRSVVAVNARRGCLDAYTFDGRYLRRKAGSVIPQRALRVLTAGIRQREALGHPAGAMSSSMAAAASPDGLPPLRPRLTAVSSTTGSVYGIDDEDIAAALEEVDDSVTYTVFAATEHVSNFYDEGGVTHMSITRFEDIDDGAAAPPAASSQEEESDADAAQEIVRPVDFDISEERVMMEDDASLLLAAASVNGLGRTASATSSTSYATPLPPRPVMYPLGSVTFAPGTYPPLATNGAASTGVAATTAPPVLPVMTGQRTKEERSITTQLILLRDASIGHGDDSGTADPVLDPFGDKPVDHHMA